MSGQSQSKCRIPDDHPPPVEAQAVLWPDCVPSHVAEIQQAVNLVGEAPDEGLAATGGAGCGERRLPA